MVVVGLASLASQTAMLTPCRAWNIFSSAAKDDSNAQREGSSNAQRDGSYNVDRAVRQAGYYDARPRKSSPAAGIQPSGANRGAMFRGQKLKMPALPFGRQSSTNQAADRVPQSNGPTAAGNTPATQSRFGAQPPSSGTTSQRLPTSAVPSRNNAQPARVADARQPQPTRSNYGPQPFKGQQPGAQPMPRPAATKPTIPNSSNVSPWSTSPSAALPGTPPARTPAQPQAAAPARSSTPPGKPAEPLSAADRLIADAHALSNQAQSEQDYTHIIETCRRVQASQASPTTKEYAKSLTAWSLNRRGQLKAEAGMDKEAILDFDDAVRNDPTCWRALHNRGVLLAQSSQYEKAFSDFTSTIQLNPQFAKAYSNRASLFLVANNLTAALSDYKRAIELDSDLAVAHRGCGRVCQLRGHIEDAIAHYDAAAQLAPTDAYTAACRADLLTDVGRYAEAAAEYDRAIELDPTLSQAQGGSAWLLATCPDSSIRNADLAVERAKFVIEQGGQEDAMNFDTLAAAQANSGDFDAAMDSARTAIRLASADERDTYKSRLTMYQHAKPYRIAPLARGAQQVNYETSSGSARAMR
jgi:tetratricopeptide (TPR) repeat protein